VTPSARCVIATIPGAAHHRADPHGLKHEDMARRQRDQPSAVKRLSEAGRSHRAGGALSTTHIDMRFRSCRKQQGNTTLYIVS
jgi:hypothetical protein